MKKSMTLDSIEEKDDSILKKGKGLNPFLLVIASFAAVVLIGTIFLVMPFSLKSGVEYPKNAVDW